MPKVNELENMKMFFESELEELTYMENPKTKEEYYQSGLRDGLNIARALTSMRTESLNKMVEDNKEMRKSNAEN